jgi:hypothetical protein
MKPEESIKKTSEASNESQTQPSPVSAPSSAISDEKAKTPVSPKAATPESKVIPLKGVASSECKEPSCTEKESDKKAS